MNFHQAACLPLEGQLRGRGLGEQSGVLWGRSISQLFSCVEMLQTLIGLHLHCTWLQMEREDLE